jgi:hypothetical protein
VVDGTGIAGGFWEDQRTGIATTLVFDAGGFAGEGEFERHGKSGLAQRTTLVVELAVFSTSFRERDGGEGLFEGQVGAMEVLVDVESVKCGVESAIPSPIIRRFGIGYGLPQPFAA